MAFDGVRISNEAAIVRLDDTAIFAYNPEARFALGVLANGLSIDQQHRELFNAYLRLRANVYIDQTDMICENHRRADGTEMDDDDHRSTHLIAVENRFSHVAVIGSMRFITKTEPHNDPLPFEDFFEISDLPIGSVEISRYIVRLDDPVGAAQVRAALFQTACAYIRRNNFNPTVAVVEPPIESRLRQDGVPLRRISEPKFVKEYNAMNLGIEIDVSEYAQQVGGTAALQSISTTPSEFMYWGRIEGK